LAREHHLSAEDYAAIQAARMRWKNRDLEEGFMAYQKELVRVIEKTAGRLTVAAFEQATRDMFEEYKDQVYVYTRDLIKDSKEQGYLLFAVSGSHEEAVRLFVDYYGFDDYAATIYERQDGKLTGQIQVIAGGKDKLVRRLMKKHGLSLEGSVAVGDSEGDIDMLDMVERPIAFNPSKKLFRHAAAKGWQVVLERKNMIYELAPEGDTYRLERTNT
jgi:HAD superfamily phosphoserine phosphatase-like hydrolase